MITRSLDELSILDRMVLDFTQVSYLVASINTNKPKKVLNAIKSYIKSRWFTYGIFCSIVKFRISWTYYRETLSWAKFTIVTALIAMDNESGWQKQRWEWLECF